MFHGYCAQTTGVPERQRSRVIGSSPSVSRGHVGLAAACTDGPATHQLRIPDPTQEGVFTTLSKGQAEAMRALPWGDRSTHGPLFTVAPPGSRCRPSRRPAPTLEVAVTPGPYRRHHHRCITDRPPPLALPAHGHPPGTPGHSPTVAPAGSPSPSADLPDSSHTSHCCSGSRATRGRSWRSLINWISQGGHKAPRGAKLAAARLPPITLSQGFLTQNQDFPGCHLGIPLLICKYQLGARSVPRR